MAPRLDLAFSLVGPGRVGTSLAHWLAAAGARAVAIAGRTGQAALAARLGARPVPLGDLASAGQELLLVAVADAALPEAAAALAARPQATVVLHTAGAFGASTLAALRAEGSGVGTFHPLKAFPRPLPDPAEARGVFFALDGDPAAQDMGRRLAAALGADAATVPEEARPLYHFAATLAAGGAVTLLALAAELAARLALPAEVARGYLELCRGAVAAAMAAPDPAAAITGPAARGDAAAVARGLDALAAAAPEKLPLARALAREALAQRARVAELGPEQRALLEELGRP